MTTRALGLFLGLVAISIVATADEGPTPVPGLEVFAPLVGTTWVTTFPGGEMTDTQTFEWVFGGKFLRNLHHVSNAEGRRVYEGETIWAWDAKDETLVWWYWNTTGGHIVGTARAEGETIRYEGDNRSGGEQTERVRGETTIGDGSWTSTQFFYDSGNWVPRMSVVFAPKE